MTVKKKRAARGVYMSDLSKKRLINRLSRVQGQVDGIKKRISEGECADDLLIQIAAVRGAMTQVAAKILEDHLIDCANTCMRQNGKLDGVAHRITNALATILKQS